MFKSAKIALVKHADVVDSVFKHRYAVKPETEREARPFVRVDVAVLQNPAVDYAAAEYFYPACAFAEFATLAAALETTYVHFYRRFGKRKERRTETGFHVF